MSDRLREAAQQALTALRLAYGALFQCSPCAAEDCQADQSEWLRDAVAEAKSAMLALGAALAEPAQEPGQPGTWPIARLTVDDNGLVQRAGLYAPGLPAGDHDVWLGPVLAEPAAEAQRDAERYRWLRERPEWLGWEHDFRPDEIDREIDSAMKESHEPATNARPAEKWCSYCRKADHTDAECWCTRAVGGRTLEGPLTTMEQIRGQMEKPVRNERNHEPHTVHSRLRKRPQTLR